jgi:hypothetical protein
MYSLGFSIGDSYGDVDVDARWGIFEGVVVCFELVYMFGTKPAYELSYFWGPKMRIFSMLVDTKVPLIVYFEKSTCEVEMIGHEGLLLPVRFVCVRAALNYTERGTAIAETDYFAAWIAFVSVSWVKFI